MPRRRGGLEFHVTTLRAWTRCLLLSPKLEPKSCALFFLLRLTSRQIYSLTMNFISIESVPQDCWNLIFEKLDSTTLESIGKTCKLFREILLRYEETHPYWEEEQYDPFLDGSNYCEDPISCCRDLDFCDPDSDWRWLSQTCREFSLV